MLLADTVRQIAPLDHSVIVTADAVADLYFASPPDRWQMQDYPSVIPPFDNLWIEFHKPTFDGDYDNATKEYHRHMPSQWGAVIITSEGKVQTLLRSMGLDPAALSEKAQQLDAEQTKWSVLLSLYLKFPNISVLEAATRTFALDKEGHVIGFRENDRMYCLGTLIAGDSDLEELGTNVLDATTHRFFEAVFLAINFTHCRNVTLQEKQPHPKENRLRLKQGQPPLLTHKTLVIDHMKGVLRSEGGMATGNSLKRAIHICRGYFAHYTEANPLFGKLTGTFWVPQHIRGTPKRGIVSKTYEVR